jgi:hypothetical protein
MNGGVFLLVDWSLSVRWSRVWTNCELTGPLERRAFQNVSGVLNCIAQFILVIYVLAANNFSYQFAGRKRKTLVTNACAIE